MGDPENIILPEDSTSADQIRKDRRASRKKSPRVDKDKVVDSVLRRLDKGVQDRQAWMDMRLQRYAKYRGWTKEAEHPWAGSSSPHVPVIAWNTLRTQAQLYNAVLSVRPVMSSVAWQKRNVAKQDNVDNLLDWQIFIEADGSKKLDEFIQGFVEDGVTVMHIPWVRETRTIHDVRVFAPPEVGMPELDIPGGELEDREYFMVLMRQVFGRITSFEERKDGYEWRIEYVDAETEEDRQAEVQFWFRDDKRIEMTIVWKALVYNGPGLFPEDLEDIVVPERIANLQPPGPSNPRGAPHVFRICNKVRLDEVKRRKRDGIYDLLTDEDLEELAGETKTAVSGDLAGGGLEEPKRQKDEMEGVQSVIAYEGQKEFTVIEAYDRWDVNGDGLEEDVIFHILKEGRKLARVRYLTEVYPPAPGLMPRRPFAEAHMIRVKNRWYSIGMPELLERMHDLMTAVLKMNLDWGELGNSPFFFYDPTGGTLKAEVIRLWPGEGYPVPDPQRSVHFPNLPQRDQSWAFNVLTMANQFTERLAMIGELQFGRVPTGKASALRTVGTTAALLQQADVRADQILLRLFDGIREIYAQVHGLNQRYLPANKQYRVIGVPEKGEDAYREVRDRGEIAGRYDFEWKATLFSSEKNLLAQTMLQLASVLISPFTMQADLVDGEKAYNLLRDLTKALHQDPDKYLKRPPEMLNVPRILAEEALSTIIAGEFPEGVPLEAAQEHLVKLLEFARDDRFGFFSPQQIGLFKRWVEQVRTLASEEARQAKMAQAAQMFQQSVGGGGGGGGGGVPTSGAPPQIGETPQLEPNEFAAEDLVGAR